MHETVFPFQIWPFCALTLLAQPLRPPSVRPDINDWKIWCHGQIDNYDAVRQAYMECLKTKASGAKAVFWCLGHGTSRRIVRVLPLLDVPVAGDGGEPSQDIGDTRRESFQTPMALLTIDILYGSLPTLLSP